MKYYVKSEQVTLLVLQVRFFHFSLESQLGRMNWEEKGRAMDKVIRVVVEGGESNYVSPASHVTV